MTRQDIDKLLASFTTEIGACLPQLIETHISWVILCDQLVYKVKKPLHLHFLDFSTMEKREFYCHRELTLNRRLAEDIYLEVVPVKMKGEDIFIGTRTGTTIDHAVVMRHVEDQRRMDLLLAMGKVTTEDMRQLAGKIAAFHEATGIIYEKDLFDIPQKFADLASEETYLNRHLISGNAGFIGRAIRTSNSFMKANSTRMAARLKAGFVRDCHGDLHSRNIFLLPAPQPFDCIEFNDDLREIDVLNEVAFLCMDLDVFGRPDLSASFMSTYNMIFPSLFTDQDHLLFIYYKSYRANIRAKINSLKARGAVSGIDKLAALQEADKYLKLMNTYIQQLQ
jgi:aminoglycoside phosphotransferase family enzyme